MARYLLIAMALSLSQPMACKKDDESKVTKDDDDDEGKKKKKKGKKRSSETDEEEKDKEPAPKESTARADPAPAPPTQPASEPTKLPDDVELKLSNQVSAGIVEMPDVDQPTALDYRTVPTTNIQIPLAPGWEGKEAGLYKLAVAPDGDAVLAFTTVGSLGELTGRLVHVEKIFEVKNYRGEEQKEMTLGPDKMKAHFADGSCEFGTTPGDMAWVLVDSGQSRKVVVIAAAKKDAAPKTRKQALAMILLMRLEPGS